MVIGQDTTSRGGRLAGRPSIQRSRSCKRICKRAQCGSMRPNAVLCGEAGVNRGSVYPPCACMRCSRRLLRPSRLPFRHFGAASDYSGAHCAGSACRTRCERLTHKMPREIVSQSWRMELERKTGFEPATFSLARRCSTPEPLPLVPAPGPYRLVPRPRLELGTPAFSVLCSTN